MKQIPLKLKSYLFTYIARFQWTCLSNFPYFQSLLNLHVVRRVTSYFSINVEQLSSHSNSRQLPHIRNASHHHFNTCFPMKQIPLKLKSYLFTCIARFQWTTCLFNFPYFQSLLSLHVVRRVTSHFSINVEQLSSHFNSHQLPHIGNTSHHHFNTCFPVKQIPLKLKPYLFTCIARFQCTRLSNFPYFQSLLSLHVVRRVTSHFSINAEQLSSHSNNKSSSFQYLLSQSFSPEQKNAFDTLSSSAAINQTNVIAMSSQSSTGSSVVSPFMPYSFVVWSLCESQRKSQLF